MESEYQTLHSVLCIFHSTISVNPSSVLVYCIHFRLYNRPVFIVDNVGINVLGPYRYYTPDCSVYLSNLINIIT